MFVQLSHPETGTAKLVYGRDTGWVIKESGFNSPQRQKNLICSTAPRPTLGPTQPGEPVASRYTDYAIPAPIVYKVFSQDSCIITRQ
jgi:hypothetical protein